MRNARAHAAVGAGLLGVLTIVACIGEKAGVPAEGTGEKREPTEPNGPRPPVVLPDGAVLAEDGGILVEPEPKCEPAQYAINHVLSTGQSNSVSNGGNPIVTTAQPFENVMFNGGVMTGTGCGDGQGCTAYQTPNALVPLVEGDSFFNFATETMSSGLANQVTFLAQGLGLSHAMLVSLHGRSGNTYWSLRKDGSNYAGASRGYIVPFAEGMRQVTDGLRLARQSGKSYVVRAVTTIHGESDHYSNESEFPLPATAGGGQTATYADAMLEWQRDYESGVKAITGQVEGVPLFMSQMSTWTDRATSLLAQHQLEAHVRSAGKVILVGPGYPLPFRGEDCLHYTAHSQRWLGAYFAKAYARTILQCKPFEPLRPLAVTRDGAVLTVKFKVPVPPLVLDTTRVTDPGNFGFTFTDGTGVAVAAVELASADEVRIRLTAAPTGGTKVLRYAQNAVPGGTCPGPWRGARGNLRDSDGTVAHHKDATGKPYELFNWAVHFDLPVN